MVEIHVFYVFLDPEHQLRLREVQPSQQAKRRGEAVLQEQIIAFLHGQLDAPYQAYVYAHLEHLGKLGHLALVEHELELRENSWSQIGHFFDEEEQLVEQFFEEGLVHQSDVFLVGQQISQNSEAILPGLGQISKDGNSGYREGAAPYRLQPVASQKFPLVDLFEAEEEVEVVVQLFVAELFLYGFRGGRDLCDIVDEKQGEVYGLGELVQIEIFLEESPEDEDVVVLEVGHFGQAAPPRQDLPRHFGDHHHYASHSALEVCDLVAVLEVYVLQMRQTPHVVVGQSEGIREMQLEIVEQFGVSRQPIPDQNVGVFLLGVLFSAGEQLGIEFKGVALCQLVHLCAEFVEDGRYAFHEGLALHGEFPREDLGADLLAELIAAVCQHAIQILSRCHRGKEGRGNF